MEYTFGQHNGGISEDDSLIAEGQVLYSANMDLTSSYDFITTSRKPTNLFTHTYEIVCMGWENNYFLAGTDDKRVYRGDDHVWTAPYDVIRFWSNSTYLFMFDASENIHRIELSDMWQADWTAYISSASPSIATTFNDVFILTEEDYTLIGYETYIYKISNNASTWDDTILLSTFEFAYNKIVGMTEVSGSVRVFQDNGDVLLWDKVDTAFAERVRLGIRIQVVHQVANIDYLIAEGVPYYLDGFTLVPLMKSFYSDFIGKNKLRFREGSGLNPVAFSKGIFYLLGNDEAKIQTEAGDVNFSYDDFIITFGTKKKFFPTALNLFMQTASSREKYSSLNGVLMTTQSYSSTADRLYIAYGTDTEKGVDYINISDGDYNTNDLGCVIYPPFDGGSKERRKNLPYLSLHAEFTDEDDSIEVYYLDGNILKPVTGNITTSTITGKAKRGNFKITGIGKEFYELPIGVIIKHDGSRTRPNAVKLYSLTYSYEDAERK